MDLLLTHIATDYITEREPTLVFTQEQVQKQVEWVLSRINLANLLTYDKQAIEVILANYSSKSLDELEDSLEKQLRFAVLLAFTYAIKVLTEEDEELTPDPDNFQLLDEQ